MYSRVSFLNCATFLYSVCFLFVHTYKLTQNIRIHLSTNPNKRSHRFQFQHYFFLFFLSVYSNSNDCNNRSVRHSEFYLFLFRSRLFCYIYIFSHVFLFSSPIQKHVTAEKKTHQDSEKIKEKSFKYTMNIQRKKMNINILL